MIREAIPIALEKRKPQEVTTEDIKLMELAAKHECLFARQVLFDRGFIEAKPKSKQLEFDDIDLLDDSDQGGEDG